MHPEDYEAACLEELRKELAHLRTPVSLRLDGRYPDTRIVARWQEGALEPTADQPSPREDEFRLWGPDFEVPTGWRYLPDMVAWIIRQKLDAIGWWGFQGSPPKREHQ